MYSNHKKEYNVWAQMKDRCYNKNNIAYSKYGGRGICVCSRWTEKPYGFKNFLEDMGERPEEKTPGGKYVYSLDRIDVDGGYCPENCRWATQSEQMHNRRPKPHSTDVTGVSAVKRFIKTSYVASIQKNGKQFMAYFDTIDDAIAWRKRKELELYG